MVQGKIKDFVNLLAKCHDIFVVGVASICRLPNRTLYTTQEVGDGLVSGIRLLFCLCVDRVSFVSSSPSSGLALS